MGMMDWLFGRPLATAEEDQQRVGVWAGIPMLGLDALSSAAYGPEAALAILIVLGANGIPHVVPITLLIVALLTIVYFSYRQTIAAYPHGGGSYTVAHENLGVSAGLLAAAALMIDYVLTVAVGISAGVGALVSAVPEWHRYTLELCLGILALITLINLRGVRESGAAFAAPTYLFVVSLGGVIIVGVLRAIASGGHPTPVQAPPPMPDPEEQVVLWWILAKAFASGCTAMTGVEAVSNGVMVFKDPPVNHARRTLAAIIAILAVLLIGISYLCEAYGIGAMDPEKADYQSVLSQLVAAVAGRGVVYYVTIASILAILCLSANTGFADFPRLCRTVALDGYLPHLFAYRGRRLVYNTGILVLAGLSAILLMAFGGVTDRLIPLFAVGAFLAFTLSQAGMVAHWIKVGGRGSRFAAVVNGIGAVGTAATLVVVLVAKFIDGAWVTVALLAGLVGAFVWVHRHYKDIGRQLSTTEPLNLHELHPPLVVVLVRGWSRITRKAIRFAMQASPEVYALHIAFDEYRLRDLEDEWSKYVTDPCQAAGVRAPRLVIVPSPYRRLYAPLMEFIGDLDKRLPGRQISIVIPELVERRWYYSILHNHAATFIKGFLYFSGLKRVTVVNVPWYLNE
jgi:amino acid transporter